MIVKLNQNVIWPDVPSDDLSKRKIVFAALSLTRYKSETQIKILNYSWPEKKMCHEKA